MSTNPNPTPADPTCAYLNPFTATPRFKIPPPPECNPPRNLSNHLNLFVFQMLILLFLILGLGLVLDPSPLVPLGSLQLVLQRLFEVV